MARKVLTNADWAQLAPLFPRKGPQAKRRLRLEGILWIHRTGAPWRDRPACFGKWATVQSAFYRWDDSGLWARLWPRMRDTPGQDHEALSLDSTAIPAHRHSAGAAPAQSEQAIGVSRGGRGTKVHTICDALGYPVAVELGGAQEGDVTRARTMLEDQPANGSPLPGYGHALLHPRLAQVLMLLQSHPSNSQVLSTEKTRLQNSSIFSRHITCARLLERQGNLNFLKTARFSVAEARRGSVKIAM